MNTAEFRVRGKEMIDYICNYLDTIQTRRVTPNVEPGYLRQLIPNEAPYNPEKWETIMQDVETKIMPGVTHWQHPRFHAYFPSGNSFPSILGDMLSDAIGCIGFSWAASPACTELETIVLDWFGKAIGLPEVFLTISSKSKGGGVIQTSASECVLVTMIAARAQAIKRLKQQHPFVEEGVLLSKLMAYCSKEAHSCVEKAAMICFVKLRILSTDSNSSLRGDTLMLAMEEDEANGLIPFFVSTTLGTTSCCSFDKIAEIGPVCRKFPAVWLHVDGAYAGNAFICPELKSLMEGIEFADSFNTNPNKWLLVNFDCSCLWVRNKLSLTSALVVDPLYLQHGYMDAAIDYRHWGVPLSRRFRSLKLWFVMRTFGISGLQAYIRHHCQLAKKFESLIQKDVRFEVCNDVKLGLVCFRLKDFNDKLNEKLLSNINASGKLHMVPALVNGKYIIRFCAVAQNSTDKDIEYAWKVITEYANELIEKQQIERDEQEMTDELSEMLNKKKQETLAYKRSFFVRMVSDPKIYNPSIANTIPTAKRHFTQSVCIPNNEDKKDTYDSTTNSSWISWPLAFLFQNDDGMPSNLVPLRFRHLDTKMRFTKKENGNGTSPEKDKDISKSPRRSPVLSRSSAGKFS